MSGSPEKKRHLLGGRFLRSAFNDQLTARGANVAATALSHRNRQMTVGQNLRESIDARVRRSFERNSRRGVDSVEKHVLESDAAPSLQWESPARVEDGCE